MTRTGAGETIVVRPTNNVYTALAAVAVVVQIVGLVAMINRASILFPNGGLFGATNTSPTTPTARTR